MSPRSLAPERSIDISALRELANLSAQSALNRHSRNVLIQTMRSKLSVAIVALASGGGLLWLWKDFNATDATFYTALVALLVAIYWGVEYALLTGRLIISKSGSIDIDWNASPHAKPATPPDEADEAAESSVVVDDKTAESPDAENVSIPAVADNATEPSAASENQSV